MSVHFGGIAVVFIAQLHVGDIFQPQHITPGQGLDDQLAELFRCGEAAAILHRVFVCRGVIGSERTGCRLDVLLRQHGGNVVGNQPVLRHLVGAQPEAHTVVGAEQLCLSHTADTFQSRLYVNLHVIVEKGLVETVVGAVEGECQQLGVLLFLGGDTGLGRFCRKLAQHAVHAVLHIDRRHVGVGTLLEIDVDGSIACIGCRGGHVGHVLYTVDGLFQRNNHGFLHRLGIRAGIGGPYVDGGRGDVGILLHGEGLHGDNAHQDNHHGNDARKYRAVYEETQVHGFMVLGVTIIPSFSCPTPSVMRVSPTDKPCSTTKWLPSFRRSTVR